ncbi:hypothetical protein LY632_10950 [Erythrobacter sp. SDW2]|uniref:hypothetical protein n=1 Tax=Erythrobacter sp. SDW2 TaxID=2907154 RepID=UPI001F427493|nr:hypothetical protein [Erythrobacter sp. SDW2]UIP06205.1 hypothetical protein LY632_10950 [Erythrobacter sp. SDW2]
MTQAGSFDLTGQWHGTYAYPGTAGPATPFVAVLSETGGAFRGAILEPDMVYGLSDALEATVIGHRSGRAVDFTKVYLGHTVGYEEPVDYVGQLSSDGQTLTGVWSLQSMSGVFEMFREIEFSEEQGARIAETIEI